MYVHKSPVHKSPTFLLGMAGILLVVLFIIFPHAYVRRLSECVLLKVRLSLE